MKTTTQHPFKRKGLVRLLHLGNSILLLAAPASIQLSQQTFIIGPVKQKNVYSCDYFLIHHSQVFWALKRTISMSLFSVPTTYVLVEE